MDGVLCDFIGGAVKIVNETLEDQDNITDPELKETIEKAIEELGKTSVDEYDLRIGTPHKNLRKLMKDIIRNNKDFWANLEGQRAVALFGTPLLLTTPTFCRLQWATAQKARLARLSGLKRT